MFKKSVCLLLCLLTAAVFCACGKAEEKKESKKEQQKSDVTLKIDLLCDRGEDYVWKTAVDDEGVVSVSDGKIEGDKIYYTVKGIKEGKTVITFMYKSPDDIDVYKVAKYSVSVAKDKKITVTSKDGTYFIK